jgi:hypothetical protein
MSLITPMRELISEQRLLSVSLLYIYLWSLFPVRVAADDEAELQEDLTKDMATDLK